MRYYVFSTVNFEPILNIHLEFLFLALYVYFCNWVLKFVKF